MLTLTPEQEQRLRAIAHARGLQRIGEALTAAFPDLAARAGERLPALVAHGVERAARHGLDHAVCVARYLACWFVWGADFESQPEGTWAGHILRQPGRAQGAKAFQLCRRAAEQLLRPSGPGLPTSAAFQTTITRLDERLADIGILGSLLPAAPLTLGVPCDIDACDIRLADPSGRRSYRCSADGRWEYLPSPPCADPVAVVAANRQPGDTVDEPEVASFPEQLHLLSPAAGQGTAARLRLRSRATHVCDPQVHPLVSLNGTAGVSDWRGPFATELMFSLPAEPAPPPFRAGALEPAIAVEVQPLRTVLEAAACGLRETGAPLGKLATRLAVYPAAQWLLSWQREPGAIASSWSSGTASTSSSSSTEAARSASRVRLERDGQPVDAARWQAGLEALDAQWARGLSRLLVVWERHAGLTGGRVDVESSLLTGSAGLTWGWAEGPRGLLDAPVLRVDGRLDLAVFDLRLQLSGELALGGSRSLLQLTVDGNTRLQTAFQRDAGQPDLALALKPAQTVFRHPLRLQVTPIATEDLAIANAAGPVVGAVVGACGLRACADGPGLQWFARVAIEPASVPVIVHHPLLGSQRATRPLLPALELLDWSLG